MLLLQQRDRNQRRGHKRGNFPEDDALPKPETYHKLAQRWQELIREQQLQRRPDRAPPPAQSPPLASPLLLPPLRRYPAPSCPPHPAVRERCEALSVRLRIEEALAQALYQQLPDLLTRTTLQVAVQVQGVAYALGASPAGAVYQVRLLGAAEGPALPAWCARCGCWRAAGGDQRCERPGQAPSCSSLPSNPPPSLAPLPACCPPPDPGRA